jgi:hypothetical protein
MFDLPSKGNIDKISLELLKHGKALDVFPTPVNKIVEYANLSVDRGIDLSVIHQSFLSKLSEELQHKFKETIGLVRGFVDRRDKKIYLDLTQQASRQNFVKLHETGHDVLTWQREILDHLDDDQTLSHHVQKEFETEANYFASATLFQHDRFDHEMKKLELGLKAPMALARKFGGSNHAAIRRYVEHSKKRCALLVLENVTGTGEKPFCSKRDFFASGLFQKTFGNIELPSTFGYTWTFTKDYYHNRKYHEKGEITLSTENGNADFVYHFFCNSYNAFVFLFPVGESNKTRTKIILLKDARG